MAGFLFMENTIGVTKKKPQAVRTRFLRLRKPQPLKELKQSSHLVYS